jgi:hypothetical protein
MPKYPDSKYDLAANTYIAKEQSFAVCEVHLRRLHCGDFKCDY